MIPPSRGPPRTPHRRHAATPPHHGVTENNRQSQRAKGPQQVHTNAEKHGRGIQTLAVARREAAVSAAHVASRPSARGAAVRVHAARLRWRRRGVRRSRRCPSHRSPKSPSVRSSSSKAEKPRRRAAASSASPARHRCATSEKKALRGAPMQTRDRSQGKARTRWGTRPTRLCSSARARELARARTVQTGRLGRRRAGRADGQKRRHGGRVKP